MEKPKRKNEPVRYRRFDFRFYAFLFVVVVEIVGITGYVLGGLWTEAGMYYWNTHPHWICGIS